MAASPQTKAPRLRRATEVLRKLKAGWQFPTTPKSDARHVEMFFLGDFAQLLKGTGFELSDTFLGYSELRTNLLKGLRTGSFTQAVPRDDDVTLTSRKLRKNAHQSFMLFVVDQFIGQTISAAIR